MTDCPQELKRAPEVEMGPDISVPGVDNDGPRHKVGLVWRCCGMRWTAPFEFAMTSAEQICTAWIAVINEPDDDALAEFHDDDDEQGRTYRQLAENQTRVERLRS